MTSPSKRPIVANETPPIADVIESSNYFRALSLPRSGRYFSEAGISGAPNVTIVNESLARLSFRGNPIGKRLNMGDDAPYWTAIVGVAGRKVRRTGGRHTARTVPASSSAPFVGYI
jgi:hypothetical protein